MLLKLFSFICIIIFLLVVLIYTLDKYLLNVVKDTSGNRGRLLKNFKKSIEESNYSTRNIIKELDLARDEVKKVNKKMSSLKRNFRNTILKSYDNYFSLEKDLKLYESIVMSLNINWFIIDCSFLVLRFQRCCQGKYKEADSSIIGRRIENVLSGEIVSAVFRCVEEINEYPLLNISREDFRNIRVVVRKINDEHLLVLINNL